jgi:hypothetical protein
MNKSNKSSRGDIFYEINNERSYQDKKWGNLTVKNHEIPGWLLIMRTELTEAEESWMKLTIEESLSEVLQVVATGVACLEQHGVWSRESIQLMLDDIKRRQHS